MKTYKGIILTFMLGLGVLMNFSSMSAYDSSTNFILFAIVLGGIWFNWQYAAGHMPQLNYLKATCVSWALSAVSLLMVINFFAEKYNRDFGDIASVFWEKSPNMFITPVIIAPLSVLFWRWIFKEVREANN